MKIFKSDKIQVIIKTWKKILKKVSIQKYLLKGLSNGNIWMYCIKNTFLLISLQIKQHFKLSPLWKHVSFFNFNLGHVIKNPSHLRMILGIYQSSSDPITGSIPWIHFTGRLILNIYLKIVLKQRVIKYLITI